MKIGYLHLGSPEHGICRFGILLAAEARKNPDLEVKEVNLILTKDWYHNRQILIDAAQKFARSDLVHIQYSFNNNADLWGQGWWQLYHLRTFMKNCSSSIIVTSHDNYYITSISETVHKLTNRFFKKKIVFSSSEINNSQQIRSTTKTDRNIQKKNIVQKIDTYLKTNYQSIIKATSLRYLIDRASLAIVSCQEEAKRLNSIADNSKTKVIPIYVEKRAEMIDRQSARQLLGLDENNKIVTLLGFIHRRKGHQLVVEAMSKLPENIQVVFAGKTSNNQAGEEFLAQLITLAKEKGVDRRLKITGYLPEKELETYLAASDLAICPFQDVSASASLSTWISVARPILAFDLPQIEEYNQLSANAILTFSPYTEEALAAAINSFFSEKPIENEFAIAKLKQELSISVILEQHLDCYQKIPSNYQNS